MSDLIPNALGQVWTNNYSGTYPRTTTEEINTSLYTMKGFKKYVSENSFITLDFRTHVYLLNPYRLTPTMDYSEAEAIILLLNEYTDNTIVYNLKMTLDSLRSTKLNGLIHNWLKFANSQGLVV